MARPRKPEAPSHTSVIASAVRLPVVRRNHVAEAQGWQAEAWRFYDRVGELRFTANWVGNMLSKATLEPAQVNGATQNVLANGTVFDIMDTYFDGEQGQSEMLRLTGIHLTVAGECYHVFIGKTAKWSVLAAGKVRQVGDNIQIDLGEGFFTKAADDLVIRMWNPHPTNPMLADSPVRSNLVTLSEIEQCNLHVQATLRSRLAGNGILFVPQDISFPIPEGMDPAASTADVFMATLGEAMLTPIGQPGDPSAVVPVVVTAPGESLAQIRHVTFWTEVDAEVKVLRDAAMHRLAIGMDVPPDIITGTSGSNHWNAWLADEASVKAHVEPLLGVIANAITTAYLRPALPPTEGDPLGYACVGNTANLRLRPNRSKEALELWDRGELNSDALLRETGFEPEDAPDHREFQEWLLRKIALGSTSPEQTQAAIMALGTDLGKVLPLPGTIDRNAPMGDDLQPRRSLEGHPQRNPPEVPNTDAPTARGGGTGAPSPLLAACDVLVYRALERAGNRLRSATQFTGKAQAADVYLEVAPRIDSLDRLLAESWSCADRVLAHLTEDVPAVVAVMDGYTRHLLSTQSPHTSTGLEAVLATTRRAV